MRIRVSIFCALLFASMQYVAFADDPIKYIEDYPGLCYESNGGVITSNPHEVWNGYNVFPAEDYNPQGELRIPGVLKRDEGSKTI